MTIARILSIAAVSCAVAGAAGAQTDACDAKAGPPSADFEHYAAEQWPQEAERFKGNRQNVSREANRLRLTLEKATRSSWPTALMAIPRTSISMSATTRPAASMSCAGRPSRTSPTRW